MTWRPRLLLIGSLLMSACGSESHGEIMLVVTTDLAIPTDLDWLDWSVTLQGDERAYRSGKYNLAERGLPATLALVSGPRTQAPVRVELVARHGGERGDVRIVRSARVAVPADGVRELVLHLSFLCSAGEGYTECAEDETCEAGACIPELVTDSRDLPAYEAWRWNPQRCFDALACIGPNSRRLRLDGNGTNLPDGGCVFDGSNASPAPRANVALVVDTGLVGNFGACRDQPDGECVVPIPHGGPGGWSAPEDASEVIELPRAVCDALRTEVATLTIAPETLECPRLSPGTPLCATEEVCLAGVDACPPSFGEGWTGYSCSSDDVLTRYPELDGCYRPDLEPERSPKARNLFCCPGDGPSSEMQPDPLLIDDMTGGPQLKRAAPQGYAPGFWWTSVTDEPSSAITPVPKTMFRYREVAPFLTEDGVSIERAACLSSVTGFKGLIAMEGFDLLVNREQRSLRAPLDVEGYDGIRFYAMAPPLVPGLTNAGPDLYVLFPNAQTSPETENCADPQDCDDFRARRPLTEVWTKYTIRFDELRQEREMGRTFEGNLYSILFAVKGREQERWSQPFDFCVSQIHFIERASR